MSLVSRDAARRKTLGALGILTAALCFALPAPTASAATVATFSPTSGVLSVFGDSADNVITISRTASGAILVNNGAVPVSGGTPTIANTTTINAFGLAGDDSIRTDETQGGAMPRALLFGQSGNDTLIGGSGADQIFGEAGNDLIQGRSGTDLLAGGDGDDDLSGGDGDGDDVRGEGGNDTLVWRNGDDSDRLDGGLDSDVAEVNGGPSGDQVFITPATVAGGVDVNVPGANLDVFAETTQVLGSSGDDRILGSGGLAGRTRLRLVGGPGLDLLFGGDSDDELLGQEGNDILLGDRGADLLQGGTQNDTLIGGPGPDQVLGEAGDDRLEWNVGDGDDRLDGGPDADVVSVRSGGAPDTVLVTPAPAGRVQVRSPGVFTLDTAAEQTEVIGGGANDVLSVGVGLGLLTKVRLDGAEGDDRLEGNDADDELVGGPGNDLLFGQGGDDRLDGGAGNDQLVGQDDNDLALGGDGDDVLFGNAGNDNLDGGAGFDFLRGGAGFDVGFGGEDVQDIP